MYLDHLKDGCECGTIGFMVKHLELSLKFFSDKLLFMITLKIQKLKRITKLSIFLLLKNFKTWQKILSYRIFHLIIVNQLGVKYAE